VSEDENEKRAKALVEGDLRRGITQASLA